MTAPSYRIGRWTGAARIAVPATGLVLLMLAVLPFMAGDGTISRLAILFVYMLLAATWNALAGYGGLVSVGQQVFLGAGAYFVIRLSNAGVPVFAALPVAAIITAILAWAASFFMLRLKEGEFAIGMWAIASLTQLLVNLDPLIGGQTGTSLIALNAFEPQTRMRLVFWAGLIAMTGVLLLLFMLLRSRTGVALQAIRDNEEAAASIGIDVLTTKRQIFVFSAFGAALAGGIWLMANITFQPDSYFGVQWTAYMIFMVLVGGIGRFEGAIIGAVIFFLFETLFSVYGVWYLIALGLTAVAFSLLFPSGIWGYVESRFGLKLLPVGYRFEDLAQRILGTGKNQTGD